MRFTSFLVQTGFEMTGFIGVETGVPGMPALLHIVEERTHKVVWRAKGEGKKVTTTHTTI